MFDAHNHLQFEAFDEDRAAVIQRAVDAGVHGLMLGGYDLRRRDLAGELTQTDGIWASAGVHPWAIHHMSDAEVDDELVLLDGMNWEPFIAFGELGLDWHVARDDGDRDRQIDAFRRQLSMARDNALPLIIHCVKANHELIRWLKKDGLPGTGAMIHSFWGSADDARQLVDLGCWLSVGTQITQTQPTKLVEALTEVGLEHLMVETDAPSRPPAQVAAERNEPAYLPCVVESLALVLGTTAEHVAQTTEQNIRSWLNLGDERLCASSE